mgnify:CR=1
MTVTLRSLAFSAFRAGSLASLCFRPGRSGAGTVLCAGFDDARAAGAFARRWAIRLGRSVACRHRELGAHGRFHVSVPVRWNHAYPPAGSGRVILWTGGLRGFLTAIRRAGFVDYTTRP